MRSDESIALSLILPLIQITEPVLRSGSPVVAVDSSLVRGLKKD